MGDKDQLSDPFTVVTDHHTIHGTPAHPSANIAAAANQTPAVQTRAGIGRTTQPLMVSNHLNKAAVNSFEKTTNQSTEAVGTLLDSFGSKPVDTSCLNPIQMPQYLNPHENGIRRSPRLRGQWELGETTKRKAHALFASAAATKASLGLFLSMAFASMACASNVTMPKHQTNPKKSLWKRP